MLGALARLTTRHPRRVVAAALLFMVLAAVGSSSVADRLDPYAAEDPSTESVRADGLLEGAGVGAGVDVVALVATPAGAESPAGRARVAEVARELRADPDVARVVTFRDGGRALLARDGRSTYLAASLRPGAERSTPAGD
jgi:putative drug exporter of the RND superfamily